MNPENLKLIAETVKGLGGDAKTSFILYVVLTFISSIFTTAVTGLVVYYVVKLVARLIASFSAVYMIAEDIGLDLMAPLFESDIKDLKSRINELKCKEQEKP